MVGSWDRLFFGLPWLMAIWPLGIPWDSLRSEKRISCYTRSVDEQAPRCIHIYHHISYIPTFEPQVGQEFNIKNAKVNYGNWIKRNI